MYRRSGLRLPRWLDGILWVLVLACAGVVVLVWVTQSDQLIGCIITSVIMILPALLVGVRGRITVDEAKLVLEMVPIFRKTIPRSEITKVTRSEVNPMRDFAGYGYRLTGSGTIGFVYEAGPAVRVTTSGGKTYVISAPDAEHLAEVLTRPASD